MLYSYDFIFIWCFLLFCSNDRPNSALNEFAQRQLVVKFILMSIPRLITSTKAVSGRASWVLEFLKSARNPHNHVWFLECVLRFGGKNCPIGLFLDLSDTCLPQCWVALTAYFLYICWQLALKHVQTKSDSIFVPRKNGWAHGLHKLLASQIQVADFWVSWQTQLWGAKRI